MKSVLLGGLKVFLINDGGFPLSAPGGRAKFFRAGTSTPETVYSDIDLTEATALGPVVYTDALGALPPVWLKTDRLYKVVVEQKVTDDPETWAVLWSVDNVGNFVPASAGVSGEPSAVVGSISELKAVDHSEHATVQVLGYYAPGDWGMPSTFVYDGNSTATPDDGAYVEPNDEEGRWIQVFDGVILDVRKFGAIPDNQDVSDVSGRVTKAVNYSQQNSTRSRPITVGFVAPGKYGFVGDYDFSIFTFTDLSDNSVHKVPFFIGNGVVFVGDNSDFTLSSNTVCLTREALIEGTNATLSVEGGGSIKVDPAWWGDKSCVVSGCYVECHSVTENFKSFTNCVITSDRMLKGSIAFYGCRVAEEMFFNANQVVAVDSLCTIDIDDFTTTSFWLRLMLQRFDAILDFRGRHVENASFSRQVIIRNAILTNCVYSAGVLEMHECQGTISTGTLTELKVYDSDVLMTVDGSINSASIYRSTFATSSSVTVLNLTMESSILGSEVTVGTVFMKDCRIYHDVVQNGTGDFVFDGCTFGAQHIINVTMALSVISGKWINNVANAIVPIVINDPDNLLDHTVNHPYIYEGNTGSFIPSKVTNHRGSDVHTVQMTKGWTAVPTTKPGLTVFLIGKRTVKLTNSISLNDGIFGYMGGSATKFVDMTSGAISGNDIFFPIMLPDITTSVGTDMIDLAEGSSSIWADLEVL